MAARARVRAPELVGKGGWLNTGDKDLTLPDLRGSIVILDFWTFCCINCLHVLDELRELEEQHRDTVVIVGVHSPKFVHEAEHQRRGRTRSSATRCTTRCSTTRSWPPGSSTPCGPGRRSW